MRRSAASIVICCLAGSGCFRGGVGGDRNGDPSAADSLGRPVSKLVYVDQGWSSADSTRFYFTAQGSEALPYDWFVHLERKDDTTLFRDNANIARYGYLVQKPDHENPLGLPVGFVRDSG